MKRRPYHNFNHKKIDKKRLRVNEEIRAYNLRVIDEEGQQLGIMTKFDAINEARNRGLDLAEVSPNVNPPIAKIMDYGKYQYIKKKQERKNKQKFRKNETKGIRLGVKIEEHDFLTKVRRAEEFLEKGNKVAIDIVLKGREKVYKDKARELMNKFVKSFKNPIIFEEEIKNTPQGLTALIREKK